MLLLAFLLTAQVRTADPPQLPIKLPRHEYRIPPYPVLNLVGWGQVRGELGLAGSAVNSANPRAYNPGTGPLNLAMPQANLSGAQRERLGQIYLQYYDVDAVMDPTMQRTLGLTSAQRVLAHTEFNRAWRKWQDAQEAMFEQFRKDNEAVRKRYLKEHPSSGVSKSVRYTIPRDVSYRHSKLSRSVDLLQITEMTKARAAVRASLTGSQLDKLEKLKGRPIASTFYAHDSGSAGAQSHPELISNVNVQAELGLSLKQYLAFMEKRRAGRSEGELQRELLARLNPEQRKRLYQYGVQYDREYSILRHDVARSIGLKQATLDKINLRLFTLEVEAHDKADIYWIRLDKNPNDSSVRSDRERTLSRYDEFKRKAILDALTSGQIKMWRQLMGKQLPDIQPKRFFG
jgi:hypothetical protein